jgi:hypothetical protein
MVFFMLGLSVAAQRGCWKLFHETPTVQPPAATEAGATEAGATLAGATLAGAVVGVDPLHATATIPTAAANAAIRRLNMRFSSCIAPHIGSTLLLAVTLLV